MKSNNEHAVPRPHPADDLEALRKSLNKEKEALVSMFLANAPLTQLNQQYQVIDELTDKLHNSKRD